jgi:hypothetical protein
MSKNQLDDLDTEMAKIPSNELADEKMVMAYEIRFWKQRAWRAEQQRDREVELRKEAEAKLERFKGLSDEKLEELRFSLKLQRIIELKDEANKIIGLSPLLKYIKEEEAITDLSLKEKFWSDLLAYYQKVWRDADE